MKLLFIDRNQGLIDKVKELGIESYCDNIFNHEGVIVSASNPMFTFGGGLDRAIAERYPTECKEKQEVGGGNERIGDIIFTITVGEDYKATPLLVEQAIQFAVDNTNDDETLLLSGLGTGIGGLPEDVFINILSLIELPQGTEKSS